MKMQTNLAGRLRNTSLPVTSGLLPLFEAVVNSIHSIEEYGLSSDQGIITVDILRKAKQEALDFDGAKKKKGPEAQEDIVGFKITDNGIGFNEENMTSFQTLDTEHKVAKGCRGVGRLLWLKAFKTVNVSSVYKSDQNTTKLRKFIFTASAGVDKENVTNSTDSDCCTIVHLDDFVSRYRDGSRKTLESIAESIFEHCLWYFVRLGGAPRISIFDDGESVLLDDLYEKQMHSVVVPDDVTIKGVRFNLIHVKLRSNSLSTHAIAFCADNRLVMEEKLDGRIPGLYGRISDESGDFIYECYVSSTYLDEVARPERTGFDLSENVERLLEDTEITLSEIRSAVIQKASTHLEKYLVENLGRSKNRVSQFVSNKAPRYRPIMSRIPEGTLNVDPDISDKDLDLALHKQLFEIENQLLSEGHEIMEPDETKDLAHYRELLDKYLSKAADLKMSDLANYVSHRKVIIDLLEMAIRRQPDGKYTREDLIHSLIMPMKKTSNEIGSDACNLWLLNERLAFHDYLGSDKTLTSMPITKCEDTKEPDICALNIYDNPILISEGTKLPLASIVVVEIKRPMRNDATAGEIDDPVEQAIGYLDRIRKGQVHTAQGRPVPASENIPGFCYIIADLTPKLQDRCRLHHDLKLTHDGLGFFGYKQNSKAYVEVISFDGLVNSAKERNRAFFDKLGLPTT